MAKDTFKILEDAFEDSSKLKIWWYAFRLLILRLLIFTIALTATLFFSTISVVFSFFYYTITFKWTTGMIRFSEYIYQGALSIDQTGNVMCQDVFNHTMVKRKLKYHKFGDEDDTISYCLAVNQKEKTLSLFGKFWCWFLNTVDSKGGGHMYKALENKIKKDLEAFNRLKAGNHIQPCK
jgi:hypothetical protein